MLFELNIECLACEYIEITSMYYVIELLVKLCNLTRILKRIKTSYTSRQLEN